MGAHSTRPKVFTTIALVGDHHRCGAGVRGSQSGGCQPHDQQSGYDAAEVKQQGTDSPGVVGEIVVHSVRLSHRPIYVSARCCLLPYSGGFPRARRPMSTLSANHPATRARFSYCSRFAAACTAITSAMLGS